MTSMMYNNWTYISLFISAPLILLWVVQRVYSNPISGLPGTRLSKWTDIVLQCHWFFGTRTSYVHSLHQKYGTIIRLGPHEVSVSEGSAARQIHSLKGGFVKSPFYHDLVPGPDSVFNTTDSDFHRRHRRLLTSPMSESSLRAVEKQVDARVKLAIHCMQTEMKKRGAVDVFKFWLFMATDVIAELSFGESFRMLELGEKNQYIIDLENLQGLGGIRTTFPSLIRLAKHIPIPIPIIQKPAQAAQRLTQYADESIQRYKKYICSHPSDGKTMLFGKLFKAGDEGLSDVEILSDAQAYIVAGSDTTANTLTYLVWAVCRDKAIKDRLAAEVAQLHEGFGDSELRNLPYLNQVIEEALRVYPAAPSALPRIVPPGGSTLCGQWIPGGYTVSAPAWSLHRDSSVFPEPDRFNPSRWEAPSKEMKDFFMPFGGGSRVCLGLHLARLELRLATARFFRSFPEATVSQLEGMSDDDMVPVTFFLLSPKGKRCLIKVSE